VLIRRGSLATAAAAGASWRATAPCAQQLPLCSGAVTGAKLPCGEGPTPLFKTWMKIRTSLQSSRGWLRRQDLREAR
jgi:hypothetical protein